MSNRASHSEDSNYQNNINILTDKLITVSSRSMPNESPGSKISLLHMREDSAENMGDFYPNTQVKMDEYLVIHLFVNNDFC